jgi:hypothetical protein
MRIKNERLFTCNFSGDFACFLFCVAKDISAKNGRQRGIGS